jgi:putative ABC transport system ATP-binding protein
MSDDPQSVLLSLREVSKTYYSGEIAVPVLHGVNLEIPHGDVLVVVGPSGSGKSTLLNIIGGIDSPTGGDVFFEGRDIARYTPAQLTLYRRDSVGFVFQFYNLVPTLTAFENVVVSTEISRNPMDPGEALQVVGLGHRLDHFPAQMSGGEQQRVAIARAVAKRPKLLLCDEPTGALDLETGRMVLKSLSRLNEEHGMTVVIITHNLAIAGIAHHKVRIGSGTIAEVTVNERRVDPMQVTW